MTRSRALSPRACAALVLIAALTPASVTAQSVATFIRGDANVDGDRNITDAVYLLGCSFLGTECPSCGDAGDLDDDGMLNITDPVYLLNFLFSGGRRHRLRSMRAGRIPPGTSSLAPSSPAASREAAATRSPPRRAAP